MIHAYDKIYLEKARTAMGRMLDFAVNELHQPLSDFYQLFLKSGIAKRFGDGEYTLLVGRSGVELAYEVMTITQHFTPTVKTRYASNRSAEYWTGWALAYYQWDTGISFSEIDKRIPITDVNMLYMPYHEMDIRQFTDKMNELFRAAKPDTNLKHYRQMAGLSQSELADLSEVPLRTIQQYEQRQKDINKAQAIYLLSFAKTLGCDVEDLIERIPCI